VKRTLLSTALVAALSSLASLAQGATFNYHGNLQDAGKPAEGAYDLELTLYSAEQGGKVIAGPLLMYKVPVHDGSFSTEADFGPMSSAVGQSWLSVKVRKADNGEFAALSARAPISADATAATSCPGSWSLAGNAGNASDSYLGTTDSQPLVFKVGGVAAGQISPGKGVWFGQASGFFAVTANGPNAFAVGEATGAGGEASFAAGAGAFVNQANSYMWGDGATGITGTTAANQYIVRSAGGVAINGAPKDASTEFSIYPSATNGGNFAEIFLGGRTGSTGGILLTGQPASTASGNDGQFFIDQYNGVAQTRRFQIGPAGGIGINTAPLNPGTEITIAGSSTAADSNVDLALLPRGSLWGYDITVQGTAQSNDDLYFSQTNGSTYIERLALLNGGIGMNGLAPIDGELRISNTAHTSAHMSFVVTGGDSVNFDGAVDASSGKPKLSISDLTQNGTARTYLLDLGGGLAAGINTNAQPGLALQVGNSSSNGNGAYLTLGGVWTSTSSRSLKEEFAQVDPLVMLSKVIALPVQTWFYKGSHAEGRHLGPVAEDFAAAFHLGNDDRHIGSVDESGVAFAAIQGLNQKLEAKNAALRAEKDAEIDALRDRLDSTTASLEELRERLNRLESRGE